MATVNEALQERVVSHAVYIQRFAGSTVRKLIALLNRADDDLVAKLEARLGRLTDRGFDTGPATTKRLTTLLAELRALNKAAYESIGKELRTELRDLAAYEAEWTVDAIRVSLPADVFAVLEPTRPSLVVIKAAVDARPFQGRLLREMLAEVEPARAARVRDAIRLGMVEGQTTEQIIRRIRGTKAAGYADGLLEIDRRHLATMARTAVNHTANYAREQVFADNADLIDKVEWVATLDGRTCPSCGALDGKTFEPHKGPRPPLHHNCRCSMAPVAKSFRELGLDLDEFLPSTRASMDGEVPASMQYGDWLKRQPAAMQDEILGPTRGKLFRKGGLTVDRFTDRAGNELTLAQLRERESAAFRRAGLGG